MTTIPIPTTANRNCWRGRTLIIERSANFHAGAKLRCPVTERTVQVFATRQKAFDYCRKNGYSVMQPVGPRDPAILESKT